MCCSMITPFASFMSPPEKRDININLHGAVTNQRYSLWKIPCRIRVSNDYPSNRFPFQQKIRRSGYKPKMALYTLYAFGVERLLITDVSQYSRGAYSVKFLSGRRREYAGDTDSVHYFVVFVNNLLAREQKTGLLARAPYLTLSSSLSFARGCLCLWLTDHS